MSGLCYSMIAAYGMIIMVTYIMSDLYYGMSDLYYGMIVAYIMV